MPVFLGRARSVRACATFVVAAGLAFTQASPARACTLAPSHMVTFVVDDTLSCITLVPFFSGRAAEVQVLNDCFVDIAFEPSACRAGPCVAPPGGDVVLLLSSATTDSRHSVPWEMDGAAGTIEADVVFVGNTGCSGCSVRPRTHGPPHAAWLLAAVALLRGRRRARSA